MTIDHSDRSGVAPGALDEPASPAQRRRRRREVEYTFLLDHRGRQHFNFRQVVWLDPQVDMAFTRVYSVALKTLAINLLTLALRRPGRRALLLAPAFSRECLMGAPDRAWALPKATIEAWFESKQRQSQRGRRSHLKRSGANRVRRK
jgi:hypothetical protein